MHDRFLGPIFSFRVFAANIVVIDDPDIANTLLDVREYLFSSVVVSLLTPTRSSQVEANILTGSVLLAVIPDVLFTPFSVPLVSLTMRRTIWVSSS